MVLPEQMHLYPLNVVFEISDQSRQTCRVDIREIKSFLKSKCLIACGRKHNTPFYQRCHILFLILKGVIIFFVFLSKNIFYNVFFNKKIKQRGLIVQLIA